MEVRSGGGDRYAASRYPGPSSGAVHGRSSAELLVVSGYVKVQVFGGVTQPYVLLEPCASEDCIPPPHVNDVASQGL